jgi:lysophospholipid acyltransferase (LPLAT)-like uncharacterized protein
MRIAKELLRSEISIRILCWLIQLYVRLVHVSGPWTVEGGEIPLRLHQEGKAIIVAFWHGRLLMMPYAWHRRAPFHMLISSHRDGRIIAGAVAYFGIGWIAGSSTAGGSSALRAMVRHLRAGDCIGITPDGPDGPAMTASEGVIALARLSGAPIVPLAYATSRRRILGTWDRFHLPLPFSRGFFLWGEPIAVPGALDATEMQSWRVELEDRLSALTAEADRRVGQEAVAPGTLSRSALRGLRRADEHR